MAKIVAFKIALEKRPSIFFPGEKLSGRVLVRLTESLNVNNLHVNLVGNAKVHWLEKEGTGSIGKSTSVKTNSRTSRNEQRRHFFSVETYFNLKILLKEKRPNEEYLTLPVGESSYYFEMQLPTNLPTSFEHSFGHIRYFIHATMDIPWDVDKHAIRLFSVISPLDLNSNEMLKEPYGVTGSKHICCGPCKSAPILCQFSINRCGFVPGESITFDLSIDNQSSREITELVIILVQKMKYHVQREVKKCFRRVAMVAFPNCIAPKSKEKWSSHLVVPPICASSNGKCRIIEVFYAIQCSFEVSGLGSKSTDLVIPITIGTKPFVTTGLTATTTSNVTKYEMCHFEPSKFSENFSDGQVLDSDLLSFRPCYPYRLEMSV